METEKTEIIEESCHAYLEEWEMLDEGWDYEERRDI